MLIKLQTIESKAVLVEFKDRESVNHIHNHCGFFKEHVGFEVPTRQLYYRVGKQYVSSLLIVQLCFSCDIETY